LTCDEHEAPASSASARATLRTSDEDGDTSQPRRRRMRRPKASALMVRRDIVRCIATMALADRTSSRSGCATTMMDKSLYTRQLQALVISGSSVYLFCLHYPIAYFDREGIQRFVFIERNLNLLTCVGVIVDISELTRMTIRTNN